jgi:hypothetical protein
METNIAACNPQTFDPAYIPADFGFSSHSTGCLGREEGKKERKGKEKGEIVGNQAHFLCFVTIYARGCVKLLRC